MPNCMQAENAAEAVRKFAEPLTGAPDRVLAKLDGPGGMASLCAVEAALARVWPMSTAKELVWLTRARGPCATPCDFPHTRQMAKFFSI
jgi:hypothetical protein